MRFSVPSAAPWALSLLAFGGAAVAQEAHDWLDRMSRSVEELNYRGTFVHILGGTARTLYIVHRNADGQSGERILSMSGAGREIVRQGSLVQSILPDQRVVLFETRKDASPLVSALPSGGAELELHYDIALGKRDRVADRAAQILEIKPLDEFRYGYTLWLDRETAMPLQSQLVDEKGNVVEEIMFTDIELNADIPVGELEPTIDTTGFAALRAAESPALGAGVTWRAVEVPGGFRLSSATQSPMAGSDTPVDHLVYSDGLATVSVFIEPPRTPSEVAEGFTNVGSTNAYTITLRGRRVTAMGEVPRQTVRTIATSLVPE
jgi:sigma-E factor negative regulatory protein RseB